MATCRTVVSLALRKLGVLGSGREPRLADQTDAFEGLQSLYRTLITTGAFRRLDDGLLQSDGDDVQLPSTITENGVARPPLDCSVVVIQDEATGNTAEWIYDGHTGRWLSLYDLTLDSIAPLAYRDPQGLAALLATTIADQFGVEPTATTVLASRVFLSSLAHRHSTAREAVPGVYC
jgi:hypothetical protein